MTYGFSFQLSEHLLHAGVGNTVRRAAVYVVPEHIILHEKHADVGHGAEVNELPHFVLQESLPDEGEEHPLESGCNIPHSCTLALPACHRNHSQNRKA